MTKFDFFENCTISCINNLAVQMAFFGRYTNSSDFPCYLLNNGDNVYMVKQGELVTRNDIETEKTPRAVFGLGGITFPESLRTLGNQESTYKIEFEGFAKRKVRQVKPIGYELPLGCVITMPDMITMTKFWQFLQEAFINTTHPFRFQSDGMMNEAVYQIDLNNPDVTKNMNFGENYNDMYPTITLSVTIKGMYPNFGFYDLRNGGHGYDGYNDGLTDFIDGIGNGNTDIDADKPIKEVHINTKVTDQTDGSTAEETCIIKEDDD